MKNESMALRDSSLCKRKADKHGDAARKKKRVWHALRQAQRECGCTTRTLQIIFSAVRPFLKPADSKSYDQELHARANAIVLQLHGCVRCDDFVFAPEDLSLMCPKCGHPRFNQKKKPNEVRIFCDLCVTYIYNICV